MGVDIDQTGEKGVAAESRCVLVGGDRLNGRDPIAIDDNCVVFQHQPIDGIEHTVWYEDLTRHEGSSWLVEQSSAPVPEVGLEPTRH